jgi:hypothetical protein
MNGNRLLYFVKQRWAYISLVFIIIFYLFNGIQYMASQSITSDEGSFYDYARRYLLGNPERIDPINDNSKMPVMVLNTLPRVIQQVLNPQLKKHDGGISDIMSGRFITLSISVLIILLVFSWARQLYGNRAGVFAALLISLCPNSLANAALVTTDSYSVLFLLATMYFLWMYCNEGGVKYFLLFSVCMALSQLVKQSLFHLYILVPLILIICYFINRPAIKWKSALKYLLIFLFINWIIINAGYYFYSTNQQLGKYHFMSDLFQGIQKLFPSWLPIFLPRPFVNGLDMAKYYDQLGGGFDNKSSFGKVTILGHSSTGGSFWYYYFISIMYKTPISYLIFFGWSAFILVRTTTFKDFMHGEFFLTIPVLYFLLVLSFFYKTQCGLRHIIFIYPFLFIFSSRLILFATSTLSKISIISPLIFLVLSVFTYWKNYYPYTNEFIHDKKMAYAIVGSANLDFLQGNYFYQHYLDKHPEVHWVSEKPQAGVFLINVEDYMDVWNRHKYDWITHIKPFGQVAYSGLLIKVNKADFPN